jgi:hypothetical protein
VYSVWKESGKLRIGRDVEEELERSWRDAIIFLDCPLTSVLPLLTSPLSIPVSLSVHNQFLNSPGRLVLLW